MNTKNKIRYLLPSLLAFAAAACLWGCSREPVEPGADPADGGAAVEFTVQIPGVALPVSRALSEEDEHRISTVDILVFRDNGTSETFLYRTHGTDIQNGGSLSKKVKGMLQPSESGVKHRIVLLANLRGEIDAVASTFAASMTKEEVLEKIKFSYRISDSGALPMWGEAASTLVITRQTTPAQIGVIPLLRAVARVDVGVNMDSEGVAQGLGGLFTIEHVRIKGNDRGYAAPAAANLQNHKAILPTVPAAASMQYWTPQYQAGVGQLSFVRCLYPPEAADKGASDASGVTHLIIAGFYNGAAKPTYYRVDFYSDPASGERFDILRNYRYLVNIKSVAGPGYASPLEAQLSKPANLDVDIIAIDEREMNDITFDGQYQLTVNRNTIHLYQNGSAPDVILKVFTDYNVPGYDGWSVTPENKPSWVNLSTSGSISNRICEVGVTATPFSGPGETRTGIVTVTAGKLSKDIVITQSAEPQPVWLTASPEVLVYQRKGGTLTVHVKSYPLVLRHISYSGDINGRMTSNPLSPSTITAFDFTMPENNTGNVLTGIITIYMTSDGEIVSKNIAVTQLTTDRLDVVMNNPYPAGGGSQYFGVSSLNPWWITGKIDTSGILSGYPAAMQAAGSNLTVPFTLAQNTTHWGDRTASFKLADSQGWPAAGEVVQSGYGVTLKFKPPVSGDNVDVDLDSQSGQRVDFMTNAQWMLVGGSFYSDMGIVASPERYTVQNLLAQPHLTTDQSITFSAGAIDPLQGAPIAGTLMTNVATIYTINHDTAPQSSKTVTFTRTMPSIFNSCTHSLYTADGAGFAITITASTNDVWRAGVFDESDNMVPMGYYNTTPANFYGRLFTCVAWVPSNDSWQARTVKVHVEAGTPFTLRYTVSGIVQPPNYYVGSVSPGVSGILQAGAQVLTVNPSGCKFPGQLAVRVVDSGGNLIAAGTTGMTQSTAGSINLPAYNGYVMRMITTQYEHPVNGWTDVYTHKQYPPS